MKTLLLLVFPFLTHAAWADDTFEQVAEKEIREFIHNELWGHYDVLQVSIQETTDRTAE